MCKTCNEDVTTIVRPVNARNNNSGSVKNDRGRRQICLDGVSMIALDCLWQGM